MKAVTLLLATFCFLAVAVAQSDPVIATVQQSLKDQGFYYGEVTGKKDSDTTAAIRRYQIRNGLQITGELNAETQKSLGVKGAISAPPPRATPAAVPRLTPSPERSNDLRDDRPMRPQSPEITEPPSAGANPMIGIFDGTPYQNSAPEVQRQVILGAQSLLARRGYYRSEIDGVFGPETEFSLRAYQERFGIPPNGRLDKETLAALGLLPGQQAPGLTAPVHRDPMRSNLPRRPTMMAPNGEPIYTPR
jgi:peptidoglycan hydrolase-like protein with peptidoglycan-binding domain